jgi:hypothetical protein
MSLGTIPSLWKEAVVKPIFKKGDKSSPGNYRPVSLTSVVCKIFETFVRDALYTHLVDNDLLSLHQFGFCKGRSCASQLLTTLHEWMSHLDNNTPIDSVYLDFSKAFDKVPHQRLVHKLHSYRVKNNLLGWPHRWVSNFLQDRCHYVSVDGVHSKKAQVTSGVPQGSVLGPVLFIYYINDMPDVVDCNIKIFADDTKLYKHITNLSDSDDLQKNIYNLNTWSEDWLLQFNSQKCKIMHIGKDNPTYKYSIKDGTKLCALSSTTCEKDLGVHIDPELKFQEHIDIQTKKPKPFVVC